MSNEDQILESLKGIKTDTDKLRGDLGELKVFIIGDKIRGVPGIIDVVETHREELYGNAKTLDVGLKEKFERMEQRVKALEGIWARVMWSSAAVSGSVVAIYTIFRHFFKILQ